MAVPYSRDSMRGLRNAMDEKFRVAGVNRIVNEIYSAAVHIARTTANSMYQHPIPRASIYPIPSNMRSANLSVRDPRNDDEKFYISNMYDILKGLRALFPECSVEYKMLTRGQDGKMYDITTIDEKLLPFINRTHDQAYVIVDWA